MTQIHISGLFIYPIKSCAGIALDHAQLMPTGLAQDRRWMVVNAQGRFVTQREQGRMALIAPLLQGAGLQATAPDMPLLTVAGTAQDLPVTVTVWNDQCRAFDEGDAAAQWFSTFLGIPVRLVRFDDSQQRLSNRDWTGEALGFNQFSDGFPLLLVSTASLADLNTRVSTPLPMNRFRPNVVLEGLPAYGEDALHELWAGDWRLRAVKPCTRCKITTTDQATGVSQGTEPLSVLMKYRRNPQLRGVTFGQNLIVIAGDGAALHVGQVVQVNYRS
jgi:uncharacterized protein YcbX